MGSSTLGSKTDAVLHGLPGHPLHPPLTDATIGMFVLATGLAVLGTVGAIENAAGRASWLALVGGVIVFVHGVRVLAADRRTDEAQAVRSGHDAGEDLRARGDTTKTEEVKR